MALVYQPPGVSFEEISSPTISPLLAVPANVCLIGLASGVQQRTDIIVLTGTTATALPNLPADATVSAPSIISVKDALNPGIAPTGYSASTDFTWIPSAKTIARQSGGIMPTGATVYVTYTYTASDYFSPIRLTSMADIEDRFGQQYNTAGTVMNSQLSYAAQLVFENGGTNVVCQPFFHTDTGTGAKSAPTAPQAIDSTEWATVLSTLRDVEDINIFVPLFGQSMAGMNDAGWLTLASSVQDHLRFLETENRHAIAILGEDSTTSTTVAQKATLQAHANSLRARYGGSMQEPIAMISPSKFRRSLPRSFGKLDIGGQFIAAALAGMIAARSVNNPLTRKPMSGVDEVADYRSKADKNADATAGLMVIEQRGRLIQPRHAITLSDESSAKRELSVVRSKYRMIESVRLTLETQIIGRIIADAEAPDTISSAIAGVLTALIGTGDVVAFSDVQTRISSLEPTLAEVRFSYRPAFPINYIHIVFSLDLSTGDLTNSTASVNA